MLGGKLYVFGGSTDTTGLNFEPQDDLYALDLQTLAWESITVSSMVPPARLFHAMAADEDSGKLFVYSGGDEGAFTGPFLPCTWAFDASTNAWSELVADRTAITDSARIKLGMLARPSEQGPTLFFFGGHDDGALGNRNDVGALDSGAGAWRLAQEGDVANAGSNGACDFPADFTLVDPASPERRSSFAFAARPDGAAFVVFGGDSDCGRLNDAWWFDATAEAWTRSGPPSPASCASAPGARPANRCASEPTARDAGLVLGRRMRARDRLRLGDAARASHPRRRRRSRARARRVSRRRHARRHRRPGPPRYRVRLAV